MTDEEILKREIKILVFDLYGTVVDMQKGLTEVAAPFLKQAGWDGSAHRFVTWWCSDRYPLTTCWWRARQKANFAAGFMRSDIS